MAEILVQLFLQNRVSRLARPLFSYLTQNYVLDNYLKVVDL